MNAGGFLHTVQKRGLAPSQPLTATAKTRSGEMPVPVFEPCPLLEVKTICAHPFGSAGWANGDRHGETPVAGDVRLANPPPGAPRSFTLIELLVVVAIVSLLLAILIPSMKIARAQAREVSCRSNLHQLHVAIEIYANERNGWYPLVPLEINPHSVLIDALDAQDGALIGAMYCPQAYAVEEVARSKDYPPKGESTSVIDTPENRQAGNISYLYWSMKDRSSWRATNHQTYPDPNMDSFRPRWLRNSGPPIPLQASDPCTPCALQEDRPGEYWVLCDFFRQSAPFPHTRKHKSGLNILFLDGHGDWVMGQPRSLFK